LLVLIAVASRIGLAQGVEDVRGGVQLGILRGTAAATPPVPSVGVENAPSCQDAQPYGQNT